MPPGTPWPWKTPGYDGVRSVIGRARFAIRPCRVTDDVRVFLSDLESSGARLAYLTPSSQFPTCRIMPTDVRERVLAWAEAADAYILEDDYCRDFRYRERSLAPLASMDGRGLRDLHGHVLEIALARFADELPRAAHAPS